MSKVVKGVGRAIGKVVKGVTNVVKKVAKSPVGKILVGAALVYFGGAALMGGLGGASAGGLSGALTGAGKAISGAWTALTSGSLGAMGNAFTGAYQAGSSAVAGLAPTVTQVAAATPGMSMAPQSVVEPAKVALTKATGGVPMSMPAPAGVSSAVPTGGPGLVSRAWEGLGPYGKAAAVSGGMQLGGAMIAKGEAEDARQQEQADAQAMRDRYNTNIGTRLYGGSSAPPSYSPQATYSSPSSSGGLVGSNMSQGGMPSFSDWIQQHGFSHLYGQDPQQPFAFAPPGTPRFY